MRLDRLTTPETTDRPASAPSRLPTRKQAAETDPPFRIPVPESKPKPKPESASGPETNSQPTPDQAAPNQGRSSSTSETPQSEQDEARQVADDAAVTPFTDLTHDDTNILPPPLNVATLEYDRETADTAVDTFVISTDVPTPTDTDSDTAENPSVPVDTGPTPISIPTVPHVLAQALGGDVNTSIPQQRAGAVTTEDTGIPKVPNSLSFRLSSTTNEAQTLTDAGEEAPVVEAVKFPANEQPAVVLPPEPLPAVVNPGEGLSDVQEPTQIVIPTTTADSQVESPQTTTSDVLLPADNTNEPLRRTAARTDASSHDASDGEVVQEAPPIPHVAPLERSTGRTAADSKDRTADTELPAIKPTAADAGRSASQTPVDTSSRSWDGSADTVARTESAGTAKETAPSPVFSRSSGQQTTKVDRHINFQRIEAAIEQSAGDGRLLSVKLRPAELGNVRIEVFQQDGRLTARLETDTPAARQVLLDGLSTLKHSLTNLGPQTDRIHIEVTTTQGSEWTSDQQLGAGQEQHQENSSQSSPSEESDPTVPMEEDGQAVSPESRSSLRSRQGLEAINIRV